MIRQSAKNQVFIDSIIKNPFYSWLTVYLIDREVDQHHGLTGTQLKALE